MYVWVIDMQKPVILGKLLEINLFTQTKKTRPLSNSFASYKIIEHLFQHFLFSYIFCYLCYILPCFYIYCLRHLDFIVLS